MTSIAIFTGTCFAAMLPFQDIGPLDELATELSVVRVTSARSASRTFRHHRLSAPSSCFRILHLPNGSCRKARGA